MFKSFFKSQPLKASTGKVAGLADASQKSLAIAKMRQEFLAYQTNRLADQVAVSKSKMGTPLHRQDGVTADWTTPAMMPTAFNRLQNHQPCIYANGAICEGRILAG